MLLSPPSTGITVPVIQSGASEISHDTNDPTSCGWPTLPIGCIFSDIALEEKGVALVPGTSFGDSAKDFVRVSYANSMENLEKAIYRLSKI